MATVSDHFFDLEPTDGDLDAAEDSDDARAITIDGRDVIISKTEWGQASVLMLLAALGYRRPSDYVLCTYPDLDRVGMFKALPENRDTFVTYPVQPDFDEQDVKDKDRDKIALTFVDFLSDYDAHEFGGTPASIMFGSYAAEAFENMLRYVNVYTEGDRFVVMYERTDGFRDRLMMEVQSVVGAFESLDDRFEFMLHPDDIPMEGVESSNVDSIGFHPTRENLYVNFLETAGTYVYFDVPEPVFQKFRNAESKGSFLHSNIKGKYEYFQVEDRVED
ncbi:MAG: KTSC domain-containing protein [Bradymonadaceae bacterium]